MKKENYTNEYPLGGMAEPYDIEKEMEMTDKKFERRREVEEAQFKLASAYRSIDAALSLLHKKFLTEREGEELKDRAQALKDKIEAIKARADLQVLE